MLTTNRPDIVCSVLIPTRNRPGPLQKTVSMLMENCSDPNRVELMFRFDSDDESRHSMKHYLLATYKNVTIIENPRPEDGYGGLYHLYNELYAHSRGKYLWIYNDDVHYIPNKDGWSWDSVINEYVDDPVVIKSNYVTPENVPATGGNLFPIVHRELIQWYGKLGIHSSIDVQWEFFSRKVGLERIDERICLKHGMGLESEHVKDGLPNTNPRQIVNYQDDIEASAVAYINREQK